MIGVNIGIMFPFLTAHNGLISVQFDLIKDDFIYKHHIKSSSESWELKHFLYLTSEQQTWSLIDERIEKWFRATVAHQCLVAFHKQHHKKRTQKTYDQELLICRLISKRYSSVYN